MPKFYDDVDILGNEFKNGNYQNLASAPAGATRGRFYYSTVIDSPMFFNGSAWRPYDASKLTDGSIKIAALEVDPRARGTHTGTQIAATISDFDTQVRTSRLDQMAVPGANLNLAGFQITALGQATADTSAAQLGQVKTLISAAIAGQTAIKNPVRAVFTSNITLSGLQNVDGVTIAAGERVAVTGQTNAVQNGIYTEQTGAWVRAVDADEPSEWVEGTEFLVANGTQYGGTVWRLTSAGTSTPGTSAMNFTMIRIVNAYLGDSTTITLTGNTFSVKLSAGKGVIADGANGLAIDPTYVARKATGTLTTAATTYTYDIAHGLNNSDNVMAQFKLAGEAVEMRWAVLDANTIRVTIPAASLPAAGTQFKVAVFG